MNTVADGKSDAATILEYGRSAGMPTAACTIGIQPSVAKTPDGKIWFATMDGVACFDPATLPLNGFKPPVVIEAASAAKTRIDFTRADTANRDAKADFDSGKKQSRRRAPERTRSSSISRRSVFRRPKMCPSRYRMEGLEQNWTKTSLRKAVYQRLPPGEYTLRVTACNNDGLWNDEGATLAVAQLPFYYETWWFRGAVIAAMLLAGYAAYRFRVAQLARVGQLRARIAADLTTRSGATWGR